MKIILSLIVLLFSFEQMANAQYPYSRFYYRPYIRPYYRPYYYYSPFKPIVPFKGLIAPKPGDFTPEFTKHFVPDSFWSKEYLENKRQK